MAKQVKLVINNRNEQVNYDSNGKESGSNTSASYNVVSETGEQIGSVNVSSSFNVYGNATPRNIPKRWLPLTRRSLKRSRPSMIQLHLIQLSNLKTGIMKLEKLVIAYKMLDDAKIKTMDDKDAIKIIKNRKAMRPHVESYDALLKDAQEKFKPDNIEVMQEKVSKWKELSAEERKIVNESFKAYQEKVDAVCNPELDKEVDITLDKLSEDGVLKLAKENEWPMNKLDTLDIMLE